MSIKRTKLTFGLMLCLLPTTLTSCGIKVENFNDIHEGDIIENYELKVEE